MDFLKQNWIKLSWVAEQLWGENNRSTTSKLTKKLNGRSSFNAEELKKLEEIREKIITNLQEPQP